ncbi:MAG: 50S ribosomal protein L22 [Rubinisphaera brasiliensis]|uniref:Large ribosomal subunit protein uL22 n=1 Tax=Rubinisphaera brasiliensis (strain ATCC 49424 / DSM 5305 / JCM 21570 / IAM 15109 / NBRC 103401 / IFAM 1448) TaxID=756272 RepID=F0SJ91_RUBBR|nr:MULTISPECIES: 50S ribosomal protein L22 [Rubinisphaera]ADY59666.1 LSU ribosomal protein L22P [Rubinisphaera brasiliensis DSM 5305]MBR9804418.1 50S ribosomal protein L22 [bacterium]
MAKVRASHRFARISPTKVREFTKLVKGMTASDGLDQLRFMHNRGAKMLEKVLKSAVANAEDRGARNTGSLVIEEAFVDMGPKFKRVRPRGRGRADMIEKKFSHIHVALDAPEIS